MWRTSRPCVFQLSYWANCSRPTEVDSSLPLPAGSKVIHLLNVPQSELLDLLQHVHAVLPLSKDHFYAVEQICSIPLSLGSGLAAADRESAQSEHASLTYDNR